MSLGRTAAALLLPLLAMTAVAACGPPPRPPSHWQQGGTRLHLPRARWVRGSHVVDLTARGEVLIDGDHRLTVDSAGRVYEPNGAPVALLEPNGRLHGPDDEDLGLVGAETASLPGDDVAWLGLHPSGELVVFDSDGSRHILGVWRGCHDTPYTLQTCLLVSHLLAKRLREARRGPPVSFGFGVGVGF